MRPPSAGVIGSASASNAEAISRSRAACTARHSELVWPSRNTGGSPSKPTVAKYANTGPRSESGAPAHNLALSFDSVSTLRTADKRRLRSGAWDDTPLPVLSSRANKELVAARRRSSFGPVPDSDHALATHTHHSCAAA